MITVKWVLEGHGAGTERVPDTDAAANVIAAALRQATRTQSPDAQAHVLLTVLAPLRANMQREGADHIAQGRSWQDRNGPLFVEIQPG
ncbi:hypothetical protein [Streptomyces sp. NBC_01429]|uniref:hypothetical protein n=1 Tax=Streptomyces sp. NBC_01429 TaxID=2903862 RepID=UPI002E2D34C3|nr:hypothetical protein [Streptomyces sp. NBC_01429]